MLVAPRRIQGGKSDEASIAWLVWGGAELGWPLMISGSPAAGVAGYGDVGEGTTPVQWSVNQGITLGRRLCPDPCARPRRSFGTQG